MRALNPARWRAAFCVFTLLHAAAALPGWAQATIDQSFAVDTARGDQSAIDFVVERPGRITVQAIWTGSAENLALILNGPGQVGFYARQDGVSPITVEYDVGGTEIERGTDWKISVVNFADGRASGRLLIEYPASPRLRVIENVALIPVTPAEVKPVPTPGTGDSSECPAGGPEHTVSEDGTIETHYPDGSIKKQRVGACDYTIVRPDGSEIRMACVQVQAEDVPELPADLLARNDVNLLLEAVGANLLDHIQQTVDDQVAVDNYLTLEDGKTLQEKIFLRFGALGLLIQ